MKAGVYAYRTAATQARLPPPLDHAHQRRGPPERHDVLRLMHGLKIAGVGLDRKVLADIAVSDPAAFPPFVDAAREASAAAA